MKASDLIASILPTDGACMKTSAIYEAATKQGYTSSISALSQALMGNARFTSTHRGWWRLAAPVAPSAPPMHTPPPAPANVREQVFRETEDRWLNSTAGVREEGAMPPEIGAVLFGRRDPYAPPQPEPVVKAHGLTPPSSAPLEEPLVEASRRAFRSTVAGHSKKLDALAWLLSHINAQIASLKQLRGVDLEEVTVHAVDLARLKQLSQTGADGLSQFEALLTTATEAHQ